MAYRDDEEALHQRVESLETDLAGAREALTRAEGELNRHRTKDDRDEAQIEALQNEVAQLRAKLGLAAPPTSAPRSRVALVALGALVVAVAAGGLVLVLARSPSGQAGAVAPPTTLPALPIAEAPVPPEPPPEPPPPPAPTTPFDVALFGAEVLAAEGRDLRPGDGCVLAVGLSHGPGIGRVAVRCGAETLYDSEQPLGTSMQQLGRGILEMPGPTPGTYVYTVEYNDFGMREGPRSQIVSNSDRHSLRVYDEGARPFSVTFHLQDRSAERSGVPLSPDAGDLAAPFSRVLHVRARPTRLTGPVPRALAATGARCELRVQPFVVPSSELSCRLVLRCGAEILYGAGSTGYARCAVEEGLPVRADDDGTTAQNNDPIMHFDWAARRITLADDGGAERWTAELALDEHPAATRFAGTWDGFAVVEPGVDRAVMLRGAGPTVEVTLRGPGGATEHAGTWRVDTLSGGLVVELPAEADGGAAHGYVFSYGPGFSTLLGRSTGPDPTVIACSLRRR